MSAAHPASDAVRETPAQIAERVLGKCSCHPAYKTRNLIAPDCVWHDCSQDLIEAIENERRASLPASAGSGEDGTGSAITPTHPARVEAAARAIWEKRPDCAGKPWPLETAKQMRAYPHNPIAAVDLCFLYAKAALTADSLVSTFPKGAVSGDPPPVQALPNKE